MSTDNNNPRPIKRHPALLSFSRDHHFGLLVGWKIRQGCNKGIEANRIQAYVERGLEGELLPHFRDEENFLLKHLDAQDRYAIQTLKEHAAIEQLAESWKRTTASYESLLQFANLLEAHIRFEERELFEYLQQQLSPEVLLELEAIERSAKEDVDGQWPDIFWRKNKAEK